MSTKFVILSSHEAALFGQGGCKVGSDKHHGGCHDDDDDHYDDDDDDDDDGWKEKGERR